MEEGCMKTITINYSGFDKIKRHLSIFLPRINIVRAVNLIFCGLGYIFKSTKAWGKPSFLKIEPSSVCNLKCLGCRQGKAADLVDLSHGSMTLDTFNSILDQTGKYLVEISFYLWGEPLLNKQLGKMIKSASDRNIASVVSTNLHFLDEQAARILINAGLTRIIVALDGMSSDTYEAVRLGGNFEKAKQGLDTLCNVRRKMGSKYPAIEWQYIETADNTKEIEAAKEYANKLGVDYFTVLVDWARRADDATLSASRAKEKAKLKKRCPWLWFAAAFQWNGDMFPCCHTAKKRDSLMASICLNNINAIWNGQMYKSARMLFKTQDASVKPETPCHHCPLI